MLKLELLQQMIIVAIALSTITCAFIQKTKSFFSCSGCLGIYSLVINLLFSIIFCYTFTTINFPESLWIGLFSFVGADTLYKSLEGKISSHKDLVTTKTIKVKEENLIDTGEDE